MPPLPQKDARKLVQRRHPEWEENHRWWRFLADSLEGGNRYRHADYTIDPTATTPAGVMPWYNFGYDPATSEQITISYKQIVDRNLIPHLSEMGEDRDLYALRLHRTPVPMVLARGVRSHLSRIYSREIQRDGPRPLVDWWADVDGSGTRVDEWMAEVVAPLFLTLGQLDLIVDHPEAPPGAAIETRADQAEAGVNGCVAGVILPENLPWWRLDRRRRYAEALVFERGEDYAAAYRHWTAEDWTLYDVRGKVLAHEGHGFGRVPIVRVFDRRRARSGNVGESRYGPVADTQRALYNALSELILGDVQGSNAILSGPEDYLQKDASIPIGPGKILPMKGLTNAQGMVAGYAEFKFLDPPKGAQDAIRQHVQDFRDDADRDSALCKPAGMVGGTTTAQSGVSKIADKEDGNAYLAEVAEALERVEVAVAELALTVLGDGPPSPADLDGLDVEYPKQFELYTLSDLADAGAAIQSFAATAGALPEVETEVLQRLVSVALPGLSDDRQEELRAEVADYVRSFAVRRQEADEAAAAGDDATPADAGIPGQLDAGGSMTLLASNPS
jgi:hypothetical protein